MAFYIHFILDHVVTYPHTYIKVIISHYSNKAFPINIIMALYSLKTVSIEKKHFLRFNFKV